MQTLAAVFLAALLSLAASAADPARPSLSGTVTDQTGAPVPRATVYIWTAAVKEGYSTFCPSCYPDCGKHADTNDQGKFEIKSLDPNLLFEVMVAKEGCAPTSQTRIDPLSPDRPVIRLPPRAALPDDVRQRISGLVVDMDGNPVPHAMVSPQGITWASPDHGLITSMGAIDGLEKFTLTNANGEFTLAFEKAPVNKWNLFIQARGFAKALFRDLTSLEASKGLKIGPGALVQGRLIRDGKPVADALMTLSHADRSGLRFLGDQYIGTDQDGRFVFAGVPVAVIPRPNPQQQFLPPAPPANGWWLAPAPDSLQREGAAVPQLIRVSKHDQVIDVGDVVLTDSLHIKGRVILSDGKPVPDGSRIYAGLSNTSFAVQRFIASDGSFDLGGLHPDDWLISVAVPGYVVSHANPNHFGGGLQGRLEKDINDLVILLDAGVEPPGAVTDPPYKPFKSIERPHAPAAQGPK